jgi:hypothetical protein
MLLQRRCSNAVYSSTESVPGAVTVTLPTHRMVALLQAELTVTERCGACGNNCTALPSITSATCSSGACVIGGCQPGFGNCDGQSVDGCEVSQIKAFTTARALCRLCCIATRWWWQL